MTRTALLAALATLAACQEVRLSAISAPPPGTVAEIDDEAKTIILSKGTAVAVACTINGYDPCGNAEAIATDEGIARSLRGYSDTLTPNYLEGNQVETSFVFVGIEPGTTQLEVLTDEATGYYEITVVDE